MSIRDASLWLLAECQQQMHQDLMSVPQIVSRADYLFLGCLLEAHSNPTVRRVSSLQPALLAQEWHPF